jgi:hypothetical protein
MSRSKLLVDEAARFINNHIGIPRLRPGLIADIEYLASEPGYTEDIDGIRAHAYADWSIGEFRQLLAMIT